jgi:uncharacterized lipoprotein YbaY
LLTYAEPAPLSPDAHALIVLVEGAGKASAGSVVASEIVDEPAQVPVPFLLDYSHVAIDQGVTYTLQATIVDGDRTWVTTTGTPVITKGNPTSGLTLALTYRPDVLKGDVTGSISGVDIQLGTEAFSAAVLLDLTTDTTVGIDVHLQPGQTPIRFAIPFDPAKIQQTTDYVVGAAIIDEPNRWENRQGVPVITKGNPISDVTVPVSAVVAATPADDGRSALVIVLLTLALLAVAVFIYQRSKASEAERAAAAAAAGDAAGDGMPAAPADPALADLVAETETAEAETAATESADAGTAEPETGETDTTPPEAGDTGPAEPDTTEPAAPEDERAPEDAEATETETDRTEGEPPKSDGP